MADRFLVAPAALLLGDHVGRAQALLAGRLEVVLLTLQSANENATSHVSSSSAWRAGARRLQAGPAADQVQMDAELVQHLDHSVVDEFLHGGRSVIEARDGRQDDRAGLGR